MHNCFPLFQKQVDFRNAYNDDTAKKQLISDIEQHRYPPRFKFEVSEKDSHRGYFSSRRSLVLTITGGKVRNERAVSHELSVPPYIGKEIKSTYVHLYICTCTCSYS